MVVVATIPAAVANTYRMVDELEGDIVDHRKFCFPFDVINQYRATFRIADTDCSPADAE